MDHWVVGHQQGIYGYCLLCVHAVAMFSIGTCGMGFGWRCGGGTWWWCGGMRSTDFKCFLCEESRNKKEEEILLTLPTLEGREGRRGRLWKVASINQWIKKKSINIKQKQNQYQIPTHNAVPYLSIASPHRKWHSSVTLNQWAENMCSWRMGRRGVRSEWVIFSLYRSDHSTRDSEWRENAVVAGYPFFLFFSKWRDLSSLVFVQSINCSIVQLSLCPLRVSSYVNYLHNYSQEWLTPKVGTYLRLWSTASARQRERGVCIFSIYFGTESTVVYT